MEVAKAHVKALLVPEAGGERFTTSAGPFAAQDWCDVSYPLVFHSLFPILDTLLSFEGILRWDADSRSSINDSPTFQISRSDNLVLMINYVRFLLGTIVSVPRVSLELNILGGRRLLSRLSTA